MQHIKWIDRKFYFGYEPGYLPLFIERLNGTASRIKELINGLSEEQLRYKPDDKWCIKQHVGHLTDLEELHDRRLDDFLSEKETLSPADMTNKKTHEADHTIVPVQKLVSDFTQVRKEFIERVKKFNPAQLSFRSMHPRLQERITVVDLLFFLAEHDNSHLIHIASIHEKLNKQNGKL